MPTTISQIQPNIGNRRPQDFHPAADGAPDLERLLRTLLEKPADEIELSPAAFKELIAKHEKEHSLPLHVKSSLEFIRADRLLRTISHGVACFGSARTPRDHRVYKETEQIGRFLAEAGYTVITGGGLGLMEAFNKGAFEAGGMSVGLKIHLPKEEGANKYLNLMVDFTLFFPRKVSFLRYADNGVIVGPGGFGTDDENFEALTLKQTGKTENFPMVYWNAKFPELETDEFPKEAQGRFFSCWEPEKNKVQIATGMISPHDLDLRILANTPREVVEKLQNWPALKSAATLS